jgi:hypothetical protein
MERTRATRRVAVACAFSAALAMACGSSGTVGNAGGEGGSAGGPGGVGAGGAGGVVITGVLQGGSSGAGGAASDGGIALDGGQVVAVCGNTTITPNRTPVDVFVVLDRSSTMYYSIAEDCYCAPSIGGSTSNLCASLTNCTNRWDAVKSALTQTMSTMTTVNWGLLLYPTPNADVCAVTGAPQVPLGIASSSSAVPNAIAAAAAKGNTPTAAAIKAAAGYLPTIDDGLKRAILLATDGAPNCAAGQPPGTDDMQATLDEIAAVNALGLPVYVVGIGPSVGNLDSMAKAGGTNGYYPATSPKQLADALYEISRIVATSCTFETPASPPVEARVWVYVDKQLVLPSGLDGSADGWTFGATSSTIVLTGSVCQNLLDGVTTNVQVIFGCPDEPPPPSIP